MKNVYLIIESIERFNFGLDLNKLKKLKFYYQRINTEVSQKGKT